MYCGKLPLKFRYGIECCFKPKLLPSVWKFCSLSFLASNTLKNCGLCECIHSNYLVYIILLLEHYLIMIFRRSKKNWRTHWIVYMTCKSCNVQKPFCLHIKDFADKIVTVFNIITHNIEMGLILY